MSAPPRAVDIDRIQDQFKGLVKQNVPLAPLTSARIGGPADLLITVNSAEDLASAATFLWDEDIPFVLLGGGSNVLISDSGVREVVIHNRADVVRFDETASPPTVWAESGANFGRIARQAAGHALAGLAWATGIPGTLGGAVIGNAGAHGSDISEVLLMAEILHQTNGREQWSNDRLEFAYRHSALKRQHGQFVVLSAMLELHRSTEDEIRAEMAEFLEYRRRTQPPGASMGSMFKNPEGDYAGRLIDHAGLKGSRQGDAEISNLHANFFINHGSASAADVRSLIILAQQTVKERFDVELELEIELIGDWSMN